MMLFGAIVAIVVAAPISGAAAADCGVAIENMSFGRIDTLADLSEEVTAGVFVTCDQIAPETSVITVCGNLRAGSGGASAGARHMLSGADSLDYQLYSDAGGNVPWGAYDMSGLGAPLTIQLPVSDGAASGNVFIYGGVFASQPNVAPGGYVSSFSDADVSFVYAEGDGLNCSAPAGGSVAQSSFAVGATVSANCLIEVDDIDFGQQGIIDAEVTAVGEVRATCTPDTSYTITMDGGLSGVADPEQRLMLSGSNSIAYGLYADANHSSPWGAGAGTVVSGTGAGDVQTLQVYGRVAPQSAAPGYYTDTVVVTISYF